MFSYLTDRKRKRKVGRKESKIRERGERGRREGGEREKKK